jgi:hypothetical protein
MTEDGRLMTTETVSKLNFIPLGRKKAVSLKKMWLISEAKEITTPALGPVPWNRVLRRKTYYSTG